MDTNRLLVQSKKKISQGVPSVQIIKTKGKISYQISLQPSKPNGKDKYHSQNQNTPRAYHSKSNGNGSSEEDHGQYYQPAQTKEGGLEIGAQQNQPLTSEPQTTSDQTYRRGPRPRTDPHHLFTPEELATMPFDRYTKERAKRLRVYVSEQKTKEVEEMLRAQDNANGNGRDLETTVQTSEPPAEPKKIVGRPRTVYPKEGNQEEISPESKSRLSTAEARREYQRQYYQMHKDKAKEYQRQYNLTHKKKLRGGRGKGKNAEREVVRSTFNTADIMHSPVEKTLKMLEKIISGERLFTM
ncbi:MAG: hypothetical protein AABW63_00755 [Nanoarchaeota archaeon]